MQTGWDEGLSDEGREHLRKLGGFCHRQPAVVTMGQPSPMGQPQVVRMSGFGLCQKDLCPMWHAQSGVCLDRLVAYAQADDIITGIEKFRRQAAMKGIVPPSDKEDGDAS